MRRTVGGVVAVAFCLATMAPRVSAEAPRQEASARFYAAWGLDPSDPQSLTDFGTLMANSGQVEEGRLYYERALEQDLGFREAAYGIAVLDLDDGKVIEAVVALNRLSRGDDEVAARAHHRLARQSAKDGFPEDALRHFVSAHEIFPENLELGLDLGTALIRRERYPEAASLSARLLEDHPQAAMAFFLQGQALKGTGEAAASRQSFEEAVKLDARQPWSLFELAALAEQEGDLDGARSLYRKALSASSARGEAALGRSARKALAKLPAGSGSGE
jgi:tetratricopeptide (TPR) repeat protein